MKVLVTGPKGFIAKNLIQSFQKHPQIEWVEMGREVGNANVREQFFKDHKPTHVVHLATLFLKKHEFVDVRGLVQSNIELTTELLDLSLKYGVEHFISFGSYYQFPTPVSLYAATKAAVEPIYDFYASQKKFNLTCLYIYDTYGPRDPRAKILNFLIDRAQDGVVLPLSPGYQKLKLLHVDDAVDAIHHTLIEESFEKSKGLVSRYALEPAEAFTLREIAQSVEKATGRTIQAKWGELPYVAGVSLDPQLPFLPLPQWKASRPLSQGLAEILNLC